MSYPKSNKNFSIINLGEALVTITKFASFLFSTSSSLTQLYILFFSFSQNSLTNSSISLFEYPSKNLKNLSFNSFNFICRKI